MSVLERSFISDDLIQLPRVDAKVTAFVEVDEPETGELSKRLLEPLMRYKANPRMDLELTLR